MSDDRVQPGAEVSKAEYEQFKQFVRDHHGSVRGNLGRELENAMREYRQKDRGRDQLTRIEDDVATVKAMLAEAESDGGGVIPEPTHPHAQDSPGHTQTGDTDTDDHQSDDPPHPKTSTATKLDWLEAEVQRRATEQDDGTYVFSVPAVRKIVDDAWNHSDPERAKDLVDRLVENRLEGWVEDDSRLAWD